MKVKKIFFTSIVLFSLLFFSCSAPESHFDNEKHTLRSLAGDIDKKIEWTIDLEEKENSSSLQPDSLASNVKASLQNIILSNDELESVYPCIEGFASLYVANAESVCLESVKSFLDSFLDEKLDFSFMEKGREYELTVFSYNFKNISASEKTDNYLLGNPFFSDERIQFPVRVFLESEISNFELKPHIDFFIYLEKKDGQWKIVSFDFFK